MSEHTVKAHGLEFVITADAYRAHGPGCGMAVFSYAEIRRLQDAANGDKLPLETSLALHLVKRVLGGRVASARLL